MRKYSSSQASAMVRVGNRMWNPMFRPNCARERSRTSSMGPYHTELQTRLLGAKRGRGSARGGETGELFGVGHGVDRVNTLAVGVDQDGEDGASAGAKHEPGRAVEIDLFMAHLHGDGPGHRDDELRHRAVPHDRSLGGEGPAPAVAVQHGVVGEQRNEPRPVAAARRIHEAAQQCAVALAVDREARPLLAHARPGAISLKLKSKALRSTNTTRSSGDRRSSTATSANDTSSGCTPGSPSVARGSGSHSPR